MGFWNKSGLADVSTHPFYSILAEHIRTAEPELLENLGDDLDAYLTYQVTEAIADYERYIAAGDDRAVAQAAAVADMIGEDYEPPEYYELDAGISEAFDALAIDAETSDVKRLGLQPGSTKIENGQTYVLNDNHRWTKPEQKGLFGEDYAAGTWSPEELETYRGEKKTAKVAPRPTERQEAFFDLGKDTDLPGQELLFESDDEPARKFDVLNDGRTKYLTGAVSDGTHELADEYPMHLGIMITPDTMHYLNPKVFDKYGSYGLDNGVFGGTFTPEKFRRMLDRVADIPNYQETVLFATAPDSFDRSTMTGNAQKTIEMAKEWLPEIRARGFPAAFVAQDGLHDIPLDQIPWDDFDVLFIGGSDDFKLGRYTGEELDRWDALIDEAHNQGKHIHVGRVNSDLRLKFAERIHADSVDGSGLRINPTEKLKDLRKWLENATKRYAQRAVANTEQDTLFKLGLQPGTTKQENGKTYILNDNHRWTLADTGEIAEVHKGELTGLPAGEIKQGDPDWDGGDSDWWEDTDFESDASLWSDWDDYELSNFPDVDKTVVHEKNKHAPYQNPMKAAQVQQSWIDRAKEIGRTEDHSNEVVISLFDASGTMLDPWNDAGYQTWNLDIKLGDDLFYDVTSITDKINQMKDAGFKIKAVLSQPPCTCFSQSGSQWWKKKHDKQDERIVDDMFGPKASEYFSQPKAYTKMLVTMTDLYLDAAKPEIYMLENPVGRLRKEMGMPKPTLQFHPHAYGDPYTKRTQIFGNFNPNLPTDANTYPVLGSIMAQMWSDAETKHGKRSLTAKGFAYAFFMAQHENDDSDKQAMLFGLQPGTTKQENGRTYVLNENHRWVNKSEGGSPDPAPKEQPKEPDIYEDGYQPQQTIPMKPKPKPKMPTPAQAGAMKRIKAAIEEITDEPPPRASMPDVEARKWYLYQESRIHMIVGPPPDRPTRAMAKDAFELRNVIRSHARELMADRAKARKLDESDPHMTLPRLIERKRKKGLTNDQIWEDILSSAAKSRKSVNAKLGLVA